jgi:hypothetical protein
VPDPAGLCISIINIGDPMQNEFQIKNFGKVKSFNLIEEVETALKSHYRGMHVSITYKSKKTDLLSSIFVSVNKAGGVFYTYGDDVSEVNFKQLFSADS